MKNFAKFLFPIPFFVTLSGCQWIISHPIEDAEIVETAVEISEKGINLIQQLEKKPPYVLPPAGSTGSSG